MKPKIEEKNRKSGINIIGSIPWGTHICHFYKTKKDLIEILVPYFKAGLENNEFCMWVTSKPLKVEEARAALKKELKNLETYIQNGQLEIIDADQWFIGTGKFVVRKVLEGWMGKEKQALKKGYDGVRLTGDNFWLKKKDWRKYADYEKIISQTIGEHRMLAICSYSLTKCGTDEIIDTVSRHQFVLIKQANKWEFIENFEHKNTEEVLKETETRYHTVLNEMNDGFFITDEKGVIIFANKALADIHGCDSPEELIGRTILEDIPLGMRDEIAKEFNASIESGKAADIMEVPLVKKDGSVIFTELKHLPVIERGLVVGSRRIIKDITARKKAEKALWETEQKYKELVEITTDWVWEVDKEGIYTYVSPKVKDLLGYEVGEVLGKTPFDLMPKEEAEKINKFFHDSVAKREPFYGLENINRHKDGQLVVLETNGIPVFDEKEQFKGFRGIDRDITKRKKIEEGVKRAKEFAELLIKVSPNGIFTVDKNRIITNWNDKACEITGYTAEEIIGKECIIFAEHPCKDRCGLYTEEVKKPIMAKECTIIRKDGQTRLISKNAELLKDEKGNIIGGVEIFEDITERKKMGQNL